MGNPCGHFSAGSMAPISSCFARATPGNLPWLIRKDRASGTSRDVLYPGLSKESACPNCQQSRITGSTGETTTLLPLCIGTNPILIPRGKGTRRKLAGNQDVVLGCGRCASEQRVGPHAEAAGGREVRTRGVGVLGAPRPGVLLVRAGQDQPGRISRSD